MARQNSLVNDDCRRGMLYTLFIGGKVFPRTEYHHTSCIVRCVGNACRICFWYNIQHMVKYGCMGLQQYAIQHYGTDMSNILYNVGGCGYGISTTGKNNKPKFFITKQKGHRKMTLKYYFQMNSPSESDSPLEEDDLINAPELPSTTTREEIDTGIFTVRVSPSIWQTR